MEAYEILLDEVEDQTLLQFLTQLEAQQQAEEEELTIFVNQGTL